MTWGQSAGNLKEDPQRLYVKEKDIMNLNAQWIVGFVDGEGCFHIGMNKNQEMKLGVQVLPEFTVVQHEVDEQVLYGLKAYFGCGVVRKNHGTRFCYRVRGQPTYFRKFFLSLKNINSKHGNVLILQNFEGYSYDGKKRTFNP
jgi:hypothetical protein